MYLGAQSRETTRFLQNSIERALVGNIGISGAQHGERPRVIFLRLLGPDLIAQRDAEFLPAVSKSFLVRHRPRHKPSTDLLVQDRRQCWLKRRPRLERAFCAWPQHAVHPVEHMRRVTFDQGARGRVGPELVKLPPEPEIAEARPRAE